MPLRLWHQYSTVTQERKSRRSALVTIRRMYRRPAHLRTRQILHSPVFPTTASLIRTTLVFNDYGEETTTEAAAVTIPCITAPATRSRSPEEGGILLSDGRMFWTTIPLTPVSDVSPGDIIVYDDERWRIQNTQRWHSKLHQSSSTRIESQPTYD